MSTDDTQDDNKHPYETEDSFHPLGEEWEDQMREELAETDYDAELGMEMARDAQRLVAGEISEEEFHDEYHDDVQEEFEMDDRPILGDVQAREHEDIEDESVLEALSDVDFEADESSRREMMKKMGAGAAFLGYGAFATYDFQPDENAPANVSGIRPKPPEERDNRWGMVIDLQRCDGCLACVAGCVDENGTSTGANWMYVFPYENEDSEQQNFLVRPCQHCSNAPCAKVCPVRARHTRSKDGLVLTDYETCIGCRYCQVACPYGVNYFQWGDPDVPMGELEHLEKTPEEVQSLGEEERQQQLSEANDHVYDHRGRWADSRPPQGVMGKCTMCPSRQDEHTDNPRGTVACQDACDSQGMSAIHFGDLDDPDSRPNEYLRRRSENQFSQGANKFDADLAFEVSGDGSFDVPSGSYPLYFLEQRTDQERPWRLLDRRAVVVAAGESFPEAELFEQSTISDFGGVPGGETSVLAPDGATDIDVSLVFDDDEFGDEYDAENGQVEFDVELRLVGATEATVDSTTVTLEEGADEVDRQLRGAATLTADGLDVPEDELYGLFLLVDGAAAASRRVLVSSSGRTDRPEPPYEASRLEGEFETVPDVLFAGESTEVGAAVEYPRRPRTHEMRLVFDDGEITTAEDTGNTISALEYEFTQQRTSNTQWDGKLSTFRLLEDLGTEPNITYLGNEPGPEAEQNEGPVGYEDISSSEWGEYTEIKSKRKEHLDYGAGARARTGENP